ncbi:hypothetical protein BD626DRAFT_518677, partial [Schizophyllum amplum]
MVHPQISTDPRKTYSPCSRDGDPLPHEFGGRQCAASTPKPEPQPEIEIGGRLSIANAADDADAG